MPIMESTASAREALAAARDDLARVRAEAVSSTRVAFAAMRPQWAHAIARFAGAYAGELTRVREADAANQDDSADNAADAADAVVSLALVSLLWLHTSGQLDILRRAVVAAITAAAMESLQAALAAQQQAFAIGQQAGSAGVTLAAGDTPQEQEHEPYGPLFVPDVPDVPTGRAGRSGYDGRALSLYYAALAAQTWQRIDRPVHTAIVTGKSGSQMADMLTKQADTGVTRALVIAEQEVTSAYRDMQRAVFAANADIVSGWKWRALPDACAFCLSQDGTLHAVDDEMFTHPRCRCEQVPIRANGESVDTGA